MPPNVQRRRFLVADLTVGPEHVALVEHGVGERADPVFHHFSSSSSSAASKLRQRAARLVGASACPSSPCVGAATTCRGSRSPSARARPGRGARARASDSQADPRGLQPPVVARGTSTTVPLNSSSSGTDSVAERVEVARGQLGRSRTCTARAGRRRSRPSTAGRRASCAPTAACAASCPSARPARRRARAGACSASSSTGAGAPRSAAGRRASPSGSPPCRCSRSAGRSAASAPPRARGGAASWTAKARRGIAVRPGTAAKSVTGRRQVGHPAGRSARSGRRR